MQAPRKAGEYHQFLCAVNWVRQSIPEYIRLTPSLYETLERAMKAADSRKKKRLSRFLLADVGWCDADIANMDLVRVL